MSYTWNQAFHFGTYVDVNYEMLSRIEGTCRKELPRYSIFDKTTAKKWTVYSDDPSFFTTCAYVCEKEPIDPTDTFNEQLEVKVDQLLDQFRIPEFSED